MSREGGREAALESSRESARPTRKESQPKARPRLLNTKAGADAHNAVVLDLIWDAPGAPLRVEAQTLKVG